MRTGRKQLAALAGVAGLALGVAALAPGTADAAVTSHTWQADLHAVVGNRVTGSGTAWVVLTDHTAEVKMTVTGLANGLPHAQHIHIGAHGKCPGPTAGHLHNGHFSVNVSDYAAFYGPIGASLTTNGDTTPASSLAIDRFPDKGSYTYDRTFTLDDEVIANIKKGIAAIIVHGIDYNKNGTYDSVLGASDLDPSLPAEATDPALCGSLVPLALSSAPQGPPETGGGSAAATTAHTAMALGGAALLAAGGAAVIARRRRRLEED